MKPLGTALNYPRFCVWLRQNGYNQSEWNFIRSSAQLYQYRDVELTVVGNYPHYFAHPHGWAAVRAQMANRGITERLVNSQ